MLTRRQFLRTGSYGTAAMLVAPGLMLRLGPGAPVLFQIPGGTLAPGDIPKWAHALVKPPAMPHSRGSNRNKDKYRIAVRQFTQKILPAGLPTTPVWGYGSVDFPGTVAENGTFHFPAFTIEAIANKETQVLWSNELVDAAGNFLPHLLPIDQSLHWANPPGGLSHRDRRPTSPPQSPYRGPVPIVTHVHGAHTTEDSDGYAEAWYLPNAADIPAGYATTGTFYDYFSAKYGHHWSPGSAAFRYPNDQPATTLWYHDHTLGMTRANVYAGPAGFWLIRGGPYDVPLGYVAPGVGDDPFGVYTEIPIAIQDRSFDADGSLFYPDTRAFFEGVAPSKLRIPFIPDPACDGLPSDVSPIWNPEFFGNVMVVNGRAWPYLEVEQRRYRFRLLNGCNSRVLILDFTGIPGVDVWQIGGDQGFLPSPYDVSGAGGRLLLAPAERADVIVDFTHVPVGGHVLTNVGPDEPFSGGVPGLDFDPADPDSTGQVMEFRVGPPVSGPDPTTPPRSLVLPVRTPLGPSSVTRQLSLNEEESASVRVVLDQDGAVVLACEETGAGEFGPIAALLGTLGTPLLWSDLITENPALDGIETWEFHNHTEDAHPIHIHQVKFAVEGREALGGGPSVAGSNDPLPGETGFKDTVIAYPGEITRVKARFDLPGYYAWHCHIVEHEDNEMMRPFHVGPIPPDAPAQ